jgi:deoxyadenosine/deoxycytidine kinase
VGKAEAIIWPMASFFLLYVVYSLLVLHQRVENWSLLGIVHALVVAGFWWTGFKSRLAKLLRESLREMMVEELQESRIVFVTWLREDAPRGESPFRRPILRQRLLDRRETLQNSSRESQDGRVIEDSPAN